MTYRLLLPLLAFWSTPVPAAPPTQPPAAPDPWRVCWPPAPGADFDRAALDTGTPLVEDLAKGRVVWTSETRIARAEAYSAIDPRVGTAGIVSEGRSRSYTGNVTPAADLHLLCIGPADGRTLWRRVLPGV